MMIKFIYKIIHYEPTPDHSDNVKRSFYFICAFILTIPATVLYIAYSKFAERSIYTDIFFYAVLVTLASFTYYFLVIRQARFFIETEIGKKYYDFGRYNTILKTFAILAMVGLIVLIGRVAIFILK